MRGELGEQAYAEAYRRCDNYPRRKHQIELIVEVGGDLAQLVRKSMVYAMLRSMRAPAKAAGCGELQDFLERGFRAFRKMKNPQRFLATIQVRETRVLERIYSATPRPFELDKTSGQAPERAGRAAVDVCSARAYFVHAADTLRSTVGWRGMKGQMRITFADWVSEQEIDVVTGIVVEFGVVVRQDRQLRTLTVAPNPDEVDLLKEFLAVWQSDEALSWTDAE